MSKIVTAEEYISNSGFPTWFTETSDSEGEVVINYEDCKQAMIEFAKLHVKEALKTALEEVPYGGTDEVRYEDVVGILTCYPETNIK